MYRSIGQLIHCKQTLVDDVNRERTVVLSI